MRNILETFSLKVVRLCIKVNGCEELTFCYPENSLFWNTPIAEVTI